MFEGQPILCYNKGLTAPFVPCNEHKLSVILLFNSTICLLSMLAGIFHHENSLRRLLRSWEVSRTSLKQKFGEIRSKIWLSMLHPVYAKWSSCLKVLVSYFLASLFYRDTVLFQSQWLACFSARFKLSLYFHRTLLYIWTSHVYASSNQTAL